MCSIKSIARLLIFCILVMRVVAAPIAARPLAAGIQTKTGFVVRVCAWPIQRPQRSTSASLVLRGPGGPHRETFAANGQARSLGLDTPSNPFRSAFGIGRFIHDPRSHRRLDRPRC